MPIWLIAAIMAVWIMIVVAVVVAAFVLDHIEKRREKLGMNAKVIEFPTGHASTEPRPHVEISLREAFDAAAHNPSHRLRSELRRPGGLQD